MGLYTLTIILLFLLADILPQNRDETTNWSEPKFEHITVENGLSDNRVLSITQDSKGFLWFGTMDGLNKYDGYKFTIYRNDPNDSTSLTDNFINTIYEDHSGELWIGTWKGLCRYERSHNVFIRYKSEKNNPNSLCGNFITSILETDQKVLWIGCNRGLNRYNREEDEFIRYYPEGIDSIIKTNVNFVGEITQDRNGRLWISNWNEGLFYYDAEKDKFIKYEPRPEFSKIFNNQFIDELIGSRWNDKNYLWLTSVPHGLFRIDLQDGEIRQYKSEPDNPNSISDNRIWSIYQAGTDSDDLWIGTQQGGLNRFNIATEKFAHYQHQPQDQWGLNNNKVYSIFKDKSGLMWIGTLEGINKFNPSPLKFNTIQLDNENPEELSGERVTTIHESTNIEGGSILWLGTNDGLYSLNRISGRFTRYQYNPENINSLSDNSISDIIESHSRNTKVLWISTLNGLNKLDVTTKRITQYLIPTNDPVHNQMYTLCEDKNGLIWIGTQGSYLYSFNPETKQFKRHGSHYGIIRSFSMDTSGKLWICTTGNGLFEFDPLTKKERHYLHNNGDLKSISNNWVRAILRDKSGRLWVATKGGLDKFDYSAETFTCFNEKDGLISNDVRTILEDGRDNLWLSTDKGISKFNPISNEFRNFTTKDGLHNNEFWFGAYANHRGEMFFGGRNGLTYFHPDSIKDKTYIPPIVLTDFQIFNKSVRPGEDSPLKKQISEVKNITLSHDQSIFSFEFAALEYRKAGKIKYAYQMENVDPDWVFTDASRRFVTYTQLDPGEYIFRVKASNSNGIWNKQMTIVNITILPPWWKTWWAYSLYVLFALGLLYSIRRYELNSVHLKNQVKLDEVKLKEREETDRMKSHFFANISHEFRTPLTLILGPSDNLLEEAPSENATKQAGTIKRNANRLLGLINQLLDLSKLEAGRLELKASKYNIVSFIKGITMSFESIAEKKNIILKVKTEKDEIELYFDKEKMTKIMTNLLSNAFKFTPEGGEITVSISHAEFVSASSDGNKIPKQVRNDSAIFIIVKDTGIGITEEELPKLFDRFYQVDSSQTRGYEGTGIGLALTKELVELHHGRISADSKLGEWSEFTIELPVGKSHLRDEEIIEENVILSEAKNLSEQFIDEITFEDSSSLAPQNDSKVNEEKNIILVVEDNSEVREFIKDSLENDFQIEEASNGEQGIKKAEQIIPDLIISDVMMPKMDGNELTKKLKNNERTSHIPIILLTAKSEQQSKLEGLKTGADDYLTKPFDIQELRIRINNLIQQRQKLRERFMREIYLNPKEVTVTSIDERFLLKASEVVEKKISDPEFSVDNFVKEMGLSRTNLYLKLNALTGLSAKEFIRTIRLKRAAHLLRNHYGRISEIAYEVGFNNPSYFAECFQKQFQQLPSQYKSKYTDQSSM